MRSTLDELVIGVRKIREADPDSAWPPLLVGWRHGLEVMVNFAGKSEVPDAILRAVAGFRLDTLAITVHGLLVRSSTEERPPELGELVKRRAAGDETVLDVLHVIFAKRDGTLESRVLLYQQSEDGFEWTEGEVDTLTTQTWIYEAIRQAFAEDFCAEVERDAQKMGVEVSKDEIANLLDLGTMEVLREDGHEVLASAHLRTQWEGESN